MKFWFDLRQGNLLELEGKHVSYFSQNRNSWFFENFYEAWTPWNLWIQVSLEFKLKNKSKQEFSSLQGPNLNLTINHKKSSIGEKPQHYLKQSLEEIGNNLTPKPY